MKNLYTLTMAIVLVISAGFAIGQNSNANSYQTTLSSDDVYTIVAGDSLAALSPDKWKDLKAMNTFLNESKRTETRNDGWVKVMIYPGEQLVGLRSLGISVANAAGTPGAHPTQTNPATTTSQTAAAVDAGLLAILLGWLPWLLVILLAAAFAYALYALWFDRNRRNAANAGPKFVDRGITDATAATEFARQARSGYHNSNVAIESFQVRNLQRRRASGTIVVGYKDGTEQSRILNNEIVYVADLHYPDGTIRRDQMLLSACGNPLRASGNVARYLPGNNFRFVDEQPVIIPVNEPGNDQPIQQPRRANENRDGVFFTNDNTAVISMAGKQIEMETDSAINFSLERSDNGQTVTINKDDLFLEIQNGRITNFGPKVSGTDIATTEETEDKANSAAAS